MYYGPHFGYGPRPPMYGPHFGYGPRPPMYGPPMYGYGPHYHHYHRRGCTVF